MATFATVRAKLKSLIETYLEGSTSQKTVYQVFDYIETQPALDGLPCAMMTPISSNLEKLTSCENTLIIRFLVKVVISDKNNQATEDLRITVIDNFIDQLWNLEDVTDTLDGVVYKFELDEIVPFNAQTDYPISGVDFLVSASTIRIVT